MANFDYAKMLLINRKFASAKANKKDMGVDFAPWDEVMHNLYDSAYNVVSKRYNGTAAPALSPVYEAMKAVYALIGELENGATLRCDAGAANTFISLAGGMKGMNSAKMQELKDKKRTLKKDLEELLHTAGADADSIQNLQKKLDAQDAKIEKEKEKEWATWKDFRPVSFSTFEKNVEIFLADMIEARKAMTLEELEAEKKARKDAKKAKKTA